MDEEDAQTAIEYLLIIGGAILIVAVVVMMLRSGVFSPIQSRAENNASAIKEIIRKVG